MKRIAVVLLALLIGGAAVAFSQGGGEPVRLVWDGTAYDCYLAGPTSTPTVTSSPPPTLPPFPTSTAQPSATATGTPVTPFYTPTIESTMQPTLTPSITPTIAPTNTPQPVGCWGTVNVPALNVRDAPYGNKLGQVYAGDTLAFDAKWVDANGDFWWRFWWDTEGVTAWVASWLIAEGDTSDCSGLPDATPVVSTIRSGCHILMGEGGEACVPFATNITAAKCLPGSFHICLQMKAANPDIWIVARLFNDKAAYDLDYDLLEFWERYGDQIPTGFDAWEPENESTPQTTDQWQRWSSFNIGLAKILAAEKNMQLMACSFGPGWPEYHQYGYLVPYLKWVAANPLSDGRYHGVASHASMYAPWNRVDMPWVNSAHISGRLYLARDVILANWDFDLATWPGVWAITEIGLSDGYSGNWDAEYTCEELASAYDSTLAVYAENGYPDVYLHWNFGQIGQWTSDHACAGLMFG